MQAHGWDANGAGGRGSALQPSALQAQQMAGERLVNQCRVGLTVFGALTIFSAESAQTRAANAVLLAVVCVLALYSAVVWHWLKLPLSRESGLKYVSVWIDISCLYALHVASLVNHSGAYEV